MPWCDVKQGSHCSHNCTQSRSRHTWSIHPPDTQMEPEYTSWKLQHTRTTPRPRGRASIYLSIYISTWYGIAWPTLFYFFFAYGSFVSTPISSSKQAFHFLNNGPHSFFLQCAMCGIYKRQMRIQGRNSANSKSFFCVFYRYSRPAESQVKTIFAACPPHSPPTQHNTTQQHSHDSAM